MTISLIWAQSSNGVIGRDGGLPWHIPEDMAHFRELTTGGVVIMGRATWESLPPKFRPLPNRRNIVVTRNPSYDAEEAEVMHSLDDALGAAADVWVIGGSAVYAAAIAVADWLFVTDVDVDVEGDAHAPLVGPAWQEVSRDPVAGWQPSSSGVSYRWRELRRA